jgi:2'-5' RNA ligase
VPRALRPPRPPLPRFAVAWFPAITGAEPFRAFRHRHDPLHAIPAHLTLVFPFPTPLSAMQVESHVRKVASGWPPIPVTLRSVRAHANEFVFLMARRGCASITGLHDKLYTRSLRPHLRRDLPYEPHVTLARCMQPDQLEAALAEAEESFAGEFSEVMREVTLLAVAPDGKIDRLMDLPLDTR